LAFKGIAQDICMILINFSHPMTEQQEEQVESLLNDNIEQVIPITCNFDNSLPFSNQIGQLVDNISLSPQKWQSLPILINPPAFSYAAVLLLAELHGRMGYFPAIVRLRPIPDSIPPRFEVAEIINLQTVREAARRKR
jgi:hypothetical protein